MQIHDLKCWPETCGGVQSGRITADVRNNDRMFEEGDLIRMQEYIPTEDEWVAAGRGTDTYDYWSHVGEYTGDEQLVLIQHIKNHDDHRSIAPDYVVLSIARVRLATY